MNRGKKRKKKKSLRNKKFGLFVFCFALAILSVIFGVTINYVVAAWTEPTAVPPGENRPGVIWNSSDPSFTTAQEAGFEVSGDGKVGGLEVVGKSFLGTQSLGANQGDVCLFSNSTCTGAQTGAFYSKLKVFGGSSQTRSVEIYQVESGEGYIDGTYDGLNIRAIGTDGDIKFSTQNQTNALTIDTSGNLIASDYIKTKTGYLDGNMLDTTIWSNLGTGTVGSFLKTGEIEENERVWDRDPFGRPAVIWKSVNDVVSGADGGWQYLNIPIDNSKAYRSSVWIKKEGTTSGNVYFGCEPGNTLNLNDTINTNPYFHAFSSSNLISGRWYLFVGYIHAENDSSVSSYSAVYDGVTGKKIRNGIDYKNRGVSNSQRHRTFNYYDIIAGSTQYFWGPRFEEINGREPTIEAMIGGYQSATRDTDAYFGGNVGIGTNSPSSKLDVEVISGGAAVIGASNIATGDYAIAMGVDTIASGYNSFTIGTGIEAGGDHSVAIALNNQTGEVISNPNTMAIMGGNVGIGEVAPATELDINGEITIRGGNPGENYILVSTNTEGHATWMDIDAWSTVVGGLLPSGTDGQTLYYNNGWTATSNLYNFGANVGIGTDTPNAKLNVVVPAASGGAATFGSVGTTAIGDYSVAMGSFAAANGYISVAMGAFTTADGQYSTAMGFNTEASSNCSIAMGRNTIANDWYSTAMGSNTLASSIGSTAMGGSTTASGHYSTSMGIGTVASGDYSTVAGYDTLASGVCSVAIGYNTTAIGNHSIAMGDGTLASGFGSTAMGFNTTASGIGSTAMGGNTMASGSYSTAAGYYTFASGIGSTAIGREIEAQGDYSVAIALNDQNGTIVSNPNTMAIMGGNVGIGTDTPNAKLNVVVPVASGGAATFGSVGTTAIGDYSVAMGFNTTASGDYSTAMGDGTLASGVGTTAMGGSTTASGSYSTSMGVGTSASGNFSTAMGFNTIAIGNSSTAMGVGTVASGVYSTAMGFNTIASGSYSTAIGREIEAQGNYSVAIALNDQNGTIVSNPNTMAIMGGSVGIGMSNPTKRLYVNGPAGGTEAWSVTSDLRWKDNIRGIDNALENVEKLRGVKFEFKDVKDMEYPEGTQVGFIAQEMLEIFPEVVSKDDDGYYYISYSNLTAVLAEAIKELKVEKDTEIEQLKQENRDLRYRLDNLEMNLEQLLEK